jgi:hypothetical protein
LYNATNGNWTTSTLSTPRTSPAAAGAGTKIVFAGGQINTSQFSDVVDIYDTRTGQWTTDHLSVPRYLITAAAVQNQLIFAGGFNENGYCDAVDIYDVSTGKWSVGRLPDPCLYAAGAVSSGNLGCFLRRFSMFSLGDTVDVYNANTGSWSSAAVLPDDWKTMCGAAAGNQVITMAVKDDQPSTAYYYELK